MFAMLLTEHHLGFLSLKGGCRGSYEPTLVKMSNCWKSHAGAQFYLPSLCRLLTFKHATYEKKIDIYGRSDYQLRCMYAECCGHILMSASAL